MKNILLYMHGGSGNKGCEAIVRSTIGILNQAGKNNYTLSTWEPEEDIKVGLDKICEIELSRRHMKRNFSYYVLAAITKLTHNYNVINSYKYRPFLKNKYNGKYAFSIGGDNYCYPGSAELMRIHNKKIKKEAKKSYLWGCSIEENILNDAVIDDLKKYDLIFARESITYNMLVNAGLDNVKLYPDPAFTLPKEECKLPDGFEENNTVGLNLSPYAFSKKAGELAEKNYCNLIEWILDNTDMKIALIPHVNKGNNSDDKCLKMIYDKFQNDRIILVQDQPNCMRTKYIISKCRFFIGARTHSTIAAYSSEVPTIVLGYSVKAKGIAKDIFGDKNNYILSVSDYKTERDVKNLFEKMISDEDNIREHYKSFMKEYINKAFSVVNELDFGDM